MSLRREDMLRELELLPMWRLRQPVLAVDDQTSLQVTQAIGLENSPNQYGARLHEGIEAPAHSQLQITPTITTPWLLYAPDASDAESQSLLTNIFNAMHLPREQVTLQLQAVSLAETQVQFAVLFGLECANAMLNTAYTELAQVRGQLMQLGNMQYLVTHHPHEMLSNPACKQAVWQDLCLLLAKKIQ